MAYISAMTGDRVGERSAQAFMKDGLAVVKS